MTKPEKTVALADSRWIGHHPTYFREFFASFLRVGARVIALCPDPEEFASVAEEVCRDRGLDPKEWFVVEGFTSPFKSYVFPGKEHDPLSTLVRWRRASDALKRSEGRSGWQADLVFFPWLDSYIRFLPHWKCADYLLGRPWAGLYFRNHHLGPVEGGGGLGKLARYAKGDFNFASPNCLGVGVLDERFGPELKEVCGKAATPFPDVTDMVLPEEEPPLARDVAERAGSRKIVGMIGLGKRKGFLNLLKTAVRCSEDDSLYFVFAGALDRTSFKADELEEIELVERTVNEHKELDNIWIDLEGSPLGEPEYNALLKKFDVIFAAYHDFPGSSNTLTKAANLEKPVIVSRGGCMEKRVSEYGLGICIDQDSSDETMAAIESLLGGNDSDGTPLPARFADYRNGHTRERLDDVLREFLGRI